MPRLLLVLITLLCLLCQPLIGYAQSQPPLPAFSCSQSPIVTDLLASTSQPQWADWIARLSGETPVTFSGQTTRLTIRHSQTFTRPDSAFAYVWEQLSAWNSPAARQTIQSYTIVSLPNDYETRNLIVDLPGTTRPDEVVILAAHLDSLSTAVKDPSPGADDNATGVATLLEAARLFRHYRFERTIRLIFFSGEEQIEKGSQAYLEGLDKSKIVGVVNVDMIGYDYDNDRCFELHIGSLPASERIGQCFKETITANKLNLTYDYLTADAVPYSDHSTFWEAGIGAVLVVENFFDQYQPGGCRVVDFNPNYHTPDDRINSLNLATGFDIARAALATTANLAVPLGACFEGAQPQVSGGLVESVPRLAWKPLPGATGYRISTSLRACTLLPAAQSVTPAPAWLSPQGISSKNCYQVEALAGACVSLPSTPRALSPFLLPSFAGWRLAPGYIPIY